MNSSGQIFQAALSAFNSRNISDAERLFKKFLKNQPKHVGALNLLTIVLMTLERFAEAEGFIAKAVALNQNSDVSFYNYGIILKRLNKPKQALEQFDNSLRLNSQVSETWNNRGATFNDLNDYEKAVADFEKAIMLNPYYADAFANKGKSLVELKRYDEAFAAYDKALSLRPELAEAFLGRGNLFNELKCYDEAFADYDKALSFKPDLAEAFLGCGNIFNYLKRYDEAFAAYDKALSLKPDLPEAFLSRGNSFFALERYEEAFAAYDKALSFKPALQDAFLGRGNSFFALRRYDAAFADYDKALSFKPDLAEAFLGRGNVFFALRRYDEAFAAYDKALALKPDLAEVFLGRGNVFFALKRYDEAFAAYDKTLSLKPGCAPAWHGRANVFSALKRHLDAATDYENVLKYDPRVPFIKGSLLHQKMHCCEWKTIGDLIPEIDSDVTSGKRSVQPFDYQAISNSARNFKLCAEIYTADRYPRSQIPIWGGERYDNTKIRIGYLSGEFRNHVTSQLMTGLFELHDKNTFELYAFDNGWDDGSEIRGRINKAFDTIVDISRLGDLQVATIMRQKQIDILVNLNGYFGEERTGVFSYKPSPIQVSYLGFSATMGADYIDYIIADRYVVLPEHTAYYTENIVYLPNTYQVSDTKRQIAVRTPSRAEFKLPDTGFIFCCFNNSFKITPDIFDLWMRLLNKVNDSVLWLIERNPAVSRNLRVEATYRNIAPERLVFTPPAKEYSDYLARYRAADLFLDTLPFNAGATANDALWAGLPLLTCSGQTYAARMAGSLLNAIRLPELITTTLEAYEQMAIDLATNPEKMAAIKRKLTDNRLTTPLFDTKLFTKHIEAAYTAMYERHQAGLPPDHIIIPD